MDAICRHRRDASDWTEPTINSCNSWSTCQVAEVKIVSCREAGRAAAWACCSRPGPLAVQWISDSVMSSEAQWPGQSNPEQTANIPQGPSLINTWGNHMKVASETVTATVWHSLQSQWQGLSTFQLWLRKMRCMLQNFNSKLVISGTDPWTSWPKEIFTFSSLNTCYWLNESL